MKRNAFTIWAIISVIIFQQSILARAAARPALRKSAPSSMQPVAGSVTTDANRNARILRVTDSQDANTASVSMAEGAGFNADASRFIVNLDGVATVYDFDAATLGIKKQGPLFDVASIASDAVRWSANEANTLYVLDTRDGATSIGSYDLQTRSLTIVKDFASVLGAGQARDFSKSAGDDDRFAFAWRAADSAEWQAVVVWDRTSDNLYTFNLQDAANGVTNFTDARLNLSGEAVIVNGDATRVWRFASQPQSEATVVAGENKTGDAVQLMSAAGSESGNQSRQNVSRDGRFSIFNSNHNGARQDVYITTINPAATANVEWTHLVNCSADTNSLQKTGGLDSEDDARATSTQSITAGDGYVEFTAAEVDKERWCGLNNATMLHESAMDINFAIKMAPKKKATIIEDGKTVLKLGKYKAKNVFRIAVESGVVNYYLKGNLIYTSTTRPTYPLMVNASLVNSMATVKNVMINGATIIPVVSISPHKASIYTGQSMQFLSQVTGVVNTAVTWTTNGGSISASGMYTAPATVGDYTVKAISAADQNVSASAIVSVVNGSDTTPPVISAVASSGVTASGATATWTTNEPADTQVEYGTTTAYGSSTTLNASMVTGHSATIAGLAANTTYHYRAKSKDAAGNLATSADATFRTSQGADTTPPTISSVAVTNVTTSGATVSWTTSEAADTQVEYGTTTGYGSSTTLNSSMVTSHSAAIAGLAAGTTYHFRVKSKDAAGNLATSGDQSFATTSAGGGGGGGGTVITDKNVYPEPAPPALPAANGTFVDPVFRTTILRVTDANDGSSNGTSYSYYPTFNSNSTRLVVYNGSSSSLYDFDPVGFRVSNKRRLFQATLPTGGYPGSEDATWSNVDPNIMYCHANMRIYAYNVVSNTYTVVKDFTGIVPGAEIWQMSRSADDNAFGFHVKDANYNVIGYAAYQRSQNIVYQQTTTDVNEVEIDKTGQFLYVSTETGGYQTAIEGRIWNLQSRQFTDLTDGAPDYAPGHKDVGRGFVVGADNWRNTYTYRPLSNGHQVTTVIDFGNDWSQATHLSMLGDDDGWALVSMYLSNTLPNSGLYRNEILQVATDGSQRVRRLAHHHSTYRDYYDTPRANISKDGRFVAFTSNWGSTTRRDMFIIKVPTGTGGGSGGGGGDTTAPVISSVSSSGVTANGATVNWTTNEASDSQVDYGTTSGYGSSTSLNSTLVASHSVTLAGLAAGTTYHYRVRSKDAAGNLATSGDQVFTTTGSGSGGGGGGGTGRQNVVWVGMTNCATNGGTLQKNGGFDGTPDAGARSQQALTGSGYLEFTAVETNKLRFCGLTHSVSGTDYAAIDFAIKPLTNGYVEVRENNVYKADTPYQNGDVFRIAVENGVVKYYKNGAVFYTSSNAPSFPLVADASLLSSSATISNAGMAATSGALATVYVPESTMPMGAALLAVNDVREGLATVVGDATAKFDLVAVLTNDPLGRKARRSDWF